MWSASLRLSSLSIAVTDGVVTNTMVECNDYHHPRRFVRLLYTLLQMGFDVVLASRLNDKSDWQIHTHRDPIEAMPRIDAAGQAGDRYRRQEYQHVEEVVVCDSRQSHYDTKVLHP